MFHNAVYHQEPAYITVFEPNLPPHHVDSHQNPYQHQQQPMSRPVENQYSDMEAKYINILEKYLSTKASWLADRASLLDIIEKLLSLVQTHIETMFRPVVHVNAISLRNETIMPERTEENTLPLKETEPEAVRKINNDMDESLSIPGKSKSQSRKAATPTPDWELLPPFPPKPSILKKKEEEKDFLSVFSKISINMSVLDLVAKVPSYARFLTEFCSNRRKREGMEQVDLQPSVASVFQTRLPEKCGDGGIFTIP